MTYSIERMQSLNHLNTAPIFLVPYAYGQFYSTDVLLPYFLYSGPFLREIFIELFFLLF